tara:strand:- start:289 stop:390 length:102 start_codon:yes stop_codon:yes gene_type:complete
MSIETNFLSGFFAVERFMHHIGIIKAKEEKSIE